MERKFFKYLLSDKISANIGPNARELLLRQGEQEFNNNNINNSIFYQINSLHQSSHHRYYCDGDDNNGAGTEMTSINYKTLMAAMNATEISEFTSNTLIQHVSKVLKSQQNGEDLREKATDPMYTCDFLKDIIDPQEGIRIIEDVCRKLPKEWTVIQLCKGCRPETSYSIFPKIHEYDAPIYLTILRHARSNEYPQPLCIRFSSISQKDLFENFAIVVNRFKQCVKVDPKQWSTAESKKYYWKLLGELNKFIAIIIADLRSFFYPWNFLFSGIPYSEYIPLRHLQKIWKKIDQFCSTNRWQVRERMLLSLAAMHVHQLNDKDIPVICRHLTDSRTQQIHLKVLLTEILCSTNEVLAKNPESVAFRRYPCILIVDERLDHFFWEEMNVKQEFCRFSTLQSLWHLYNYYKDDIRNGYLHLRIDDGACLVNPDNNLPKMEMRMRSFFDYWTPEWKKLIGDKPKLDDLFTEFLNHKCYVYAGHGSGLQYVNGRNIAKRRINSVIFLFGCDSSRLYSNGLFSELIGPHLYYHAAMCPALVGTLMPGLDLCMDKVATEIISRWIVPKSLAVLPWNEIDADLWSKEGKIQASKKHKNSNKLPTMAASSKYSIASLCGVLSHIHQRKGEKKLYNIVPYVCRGLPVWNTVINEPPPSGLNDEIA